MYPSDIYFKIMIWDLNKCYMKNYRYDKPSKLFLTPEPNWA
jgi:hypothetical protein